MSKGDHSEFIELIMGYRLNNGDEEYESLLCSLPSHATLILRLIERGESPDAIIDALATRFDPDFPNAEHQRAIRAAHVTFVNMLPIIRKALD